MEAEERRLSGEIEALLAAAGEADAAEDARLGADVRGDELPAELRRREDRLAAIRAAKSRLEAQQRAADDARGRQPDQDRHPKGGRPYKRLLPLLRRDVSTKARFQRSRTPRAGS